MLTIKNPKQYLSGDNVLAQAGLLIPKYAKNPLFIGGPRALEASWETILFSYTLSGETLSEPLVFHGYPSERQFMSYADKILEGGYDAIVTIGGGRVIDTGKAAAELAGVPVITIPTIAATCAAWAALTVQYDDSGAFVKLKALKACPDLVIADTRVILKAPTRYLYAGVVDTLAKLYENRPSLKAHPESLSIEMGVHAAKLAFDKLTEQTDTAILEAYQNRFSQAAKDVVDSIIYLAGFVGSYTEGYSKYNFAHPFYHVSTRLPSTHGKLHGEKVAFGILAQLFLTDASEKEIKETADLFAHYQNLYTFDDLGLDEAGIDFIKSDVKKTFSYVTWPEEDIKKALEKADHYAREVLAS